MNKKYKSILGIISPQRLVDLRLQGMSLQEIATRLDIQKSSLTNVYLKFRDNNFDNYVPIDCDMLRKELESDMIFSEIAHKHQLSPRGLRNYMLDYGIPDRLTESRLREVAATARSKAAIAEFFGVEVHTIFNKLKKYGIKME